SGYVMNVAPSAVDARRFETLLFAGRQAMTAGDAAGARPLLDEGLALWRGDGVGESSASAFQHSDAARLEEERLAAIELRIDAELALGRHPEVVAELESLVARHPFREHFVAQLMAALAGTGRQAEALRVFQSARGVLVEELGVEPS